MSRDPNDHDIGGADWHRWSTGVYLDPELNVRPLTVGDGGLPSIGDEDPSLTAEILAARFRDQYLQEDARAAMARGEPVERLVTAEDGTRHLRRVSPHRTPEGRINGAIVVYVDIDDASRARDLRESDRHQRQLIDGIRDYALFLLDAQGRVVAWPTAAERVLGYTATEAVGQPLTFILPPEQRSPEVLADLLRQAAERDSLPDEGWKIRRDGSRLWGRGILSVIREGDRITGYVKILRDNSDRKAAEDRLRAAIRRAERDGEIKEEYLAMVAHELRTPLNAVLLWADLLNEPERIGPEQIQAGLRVIQHCAREQQQLIDDLVDLARLVPGKLKLERREVALNELVTAAFEAIRITAEANEVTLSQHLDAAAGRVYADPHRLHQVIWNLLANAVKYTPAGGNVSIQVSREGHQVVIVVRDSGEGIPAALLPEIFNRYRRGGNGAKGRSGGLGLGLAITKELVELHGGTITASSDGEDRGSVFRVELPLPAVEGISSDPHRGLRDRRILVVDDNRQTRLAVQVLLNAAGAQVYGVATASEALLAFAEWRPDVLVSDLGLPETDGFELLRRIRRLEAERGSTRTPAVAMTALGGGDADARARRGGFDACLAKPIDATTLREILETALADGGPRRVEPPGLPG